MLHIHPVPAFRDNYIWVIHNQSKAVVIDPGDAPPVIEFLTLNQLQLKAILITHHHSDHTGGIEQLRRWCEVPVYGPAAETIATVTHPIHEPDQITIPELPLHLTVLDIPGHTSGHIAYYGHEPFNMVFCGDTLFSCGCGRIFEGTPQQMYQSLLKLARLPNDTLIFCTHEYTLGNVSFARMIDPNNNDLIDFELKVQQLRQRNSPTIPTSLKLECAINPFLRCNQPEIITNTQRHAGKPLSDPIAVFTALREWKNRF